MNRVQRMVGAVVALGLVCVSVLLGLSFLPSRVEASEKGNILPWLIEWGLIGVAVISGVAIAGYFLFTTEEREAGHASKHGEMS